MGQGANYRRGSERGIGRGGSDYPIIMIVPRGEKLLGQRAREGKNETEERIHRDREKEAKMIYVGEGGRGRERGGRCPS